MTETPDFIKRLREPEANTAKEKRETAKKKSDYIKQNFTSEAYGWESLFGSTVKNEIKNLVGEPDKKELWMVGVEESIRDLVSEYMCIPDSLTGPEFYHALVTGVKYEYEYYNAQATKLKKLLDLLTQGVDY
jgi:hypothetical protein